MEKLQSRRASTNLTQKELNYHKIQNLENIKSKICLKLKVFMLLLDERHIGKNKISLSLRVKLPQPSMFKSKILEKSAIDSLYSELIILKF